MMLSFVLIAGTLAAAAAVLLLWPLFAKRADGMPAASFAGAAVVVALLLGAGALYAAWSNYSWEAAPAVADTPAAMADKLAHRLAREPNDLQGWLLLGRSYSVLEQFPLAIRAYQRADRLADGKNVEAILGVAESLLAEDPDELSGPAGRLFERVLELQPDNAKALFYGAFAAMVRGELPTARERFERMLALNPPEKIRGIIEQRISAIDHALAGGQSSSSDAASSARVQVHVTLSPQLKTRIPEGAILFVAARDPDNPGPPFAAKRLSATFPLDVELSAADAMMPSRHIEDGQTLEIVARVALGGVATPTRGDPYGQVGYHVGKDGRLNIVIDRLAE